MGHRDAEPMTPTELFENTMDWLQDHYEDFGFCLERDVAWTVQKYIAREIEASHLPYRIVHEYSRADLVIFHADSIAVVIEFKYEPRPSRSVAGKFPVTEWPAIVKDIHKNIERVEDGQAKAVYSVFIDEGGYFHERQRAPDRSEWRDWGEGRWVLWSQAPT